MRSVITMPAVGSGTTAAISGGPTKMTELVSDRDDRLASVGKFRDPRRERVPAARWEKKGTDDGSLARGLSCAPTNSLKHFAVDKVIASIVVKRRAAMRWGPGRRGAGGGTRFELRFGCMAVSMCCNLWRLVTGYAGLFNNLSTLINSSVAGN